MRLCPSYGRVVIRRAVSRNIWRSLFDLYTKNIKQTKEKTLRKGDQKNIKFCVRPSTSSDKYSSLCCYVAYEEGEEWDVRRKNDGRKIFECFLFSFIFFVFRFFSLKSVFLLCLGAMLYCVKRTRLNIRERKSARDNKRGTTRSEDQTLCSQKARRPWPTVRPLCKDSRVV